MATPVLKCVRREEREKDGFSSFKEWVEAPSHIYIGHNIRKYLTLLSLGGALCARRLFKAIFLQVLVKDHGLKLSDF